MSVKSMLYIIRRTPYENVRALETIDAILIGAVFELKVGVLFADDGVWQLVTSQSGPAGSKNIAQQLSVLPGYDIDSIWVCAESLAARSLTAANLCLPAVPVAQAEQRALLLEHEILLND